MYFIYMLRCMDDSIYTGITNDLNNRMSEHFNKKKSGAKYTKTHDAKKVESVWKCKEKSLACKLEFHIKSLKKCEKEELICNKKISRFLKGKVDGRRYSVVDINNLLEDKYLGNI